MIELRDYQQRGVDEIRAAYNSGFRAPLYVAPCGAGKTVLFAYVAANARKRGNSTIIAVHRQELLNQTVRTLQRFDVPCGEISAGSRGVSRELVQVASVQTLARRLDRISAPTLVVFDEAHHCAASTWRKVIAAWPTSKILGVTATPWRMNGAGLGSIFDKLIIGPAVQELMASQWLAIPKYYVPPQIANISSMHVRAGDFAKDEAAFEMDKPHITGDAVSHYKRICPHVPAVAFASSISHAEHIADAFRLNGVPSASIDGTLSNDERAARIRSLADGSIKVLTSCELISEGFDLPAVTAAILLRPTQSLAVHIQQIGRALRPAPDKTHAVILDHVGNVVRNGCIEDARDWSLDGIQRKEKASNDNFPHRQCPECFVVYPASRQMCPECGTAAKPTQREIKQREGELELLQQAEIAKQRKLARRSVAMAQTLEELEAIGKQRGYRPGWAHFIYSSRRNRRAYA